VLMRPLFILFQLSRYSHWSSRCRKLGQGERHSPLPIHAIGTAGW
jgi:hypothetical protein